MPLAELVLTEDQAPFRFMGPGALPLALGLKANQPIALIGSGGKTTLLFQLAEYWVAQGLSPLVTTTTQMYKPEPSAWLSVSQYDEHLELAPQAHFLYGSLLDSGGAAKVQGLAPQLVVQLQDRYPNRPLIYEADGSRHMPLKFHGSHEPVVASPQHFVVLVAGMSAWGQPIAAKNCHRLELHPHFEGRRLDQTSLAQLLEIAVQHCRPNAIVLNQADHFPEGFCLDTLCTQLSEQLGLPVITHRSLAG